MWLYLFLTILLLIGFGVAIVMARKTKATQVISGISAEDLVQIAKVVAKAVAEEMASKGVVGRGYSPEVGMGEDGKITIDESVIPIEVSTENMGDSNITEKVKEEKTVDTGLGNSKNKLAALLKRKKG